MTATDTSRKAYYEIKREGLLSRSRMQVYECLYHNGAMTGRELNETLGNDSAHKRLSELHKRGVITKKGKRDCRITGRTATVWVVTEALPSEPDKQFTESTSRDKKALNELRREAMDEHGMFLIDAKTLRTLVSEANWNMRVNDKTKEVDIRT